MRLSPLRISSRVIFCANTSTSLRPRMNVSRLKLPAAKNFFTVNTVSAVFDRREMLLRHQHFTASRLDSLQQTLCVGNCAHTRLEILLKQPLVFFRESSTGSSSHPLPWRVDWAAAWWMW